MRHALYTGLLLAVLIPQGATADPFRINIEAWQREHERLRAEALKRVDPDSLLDRVWANRSFKNQPLRSVLDGLSEAVGDRLLIDGKALAEADADAIRITLDQQKASVRMLLTDVLKRSGAEARGIRFAVIDDLIVVSNDEHIALLKRWFAAARRPGVTGDASAPFAARIGAAGECVCTEQVEFGMTIANVTLAEALKEVADEARIPIEADWHSLKQRGIDPESEVNLLPSFLRIPNVSIASALAMLLHQYDGFWACSLYERDGKIVISANRPPTPQRNRGERNDVGQHDQQDRHDEPPLPSLVSLAREYRDVANRFAACCGLRMIE
jgi:hypothetical protein